MHPPRALSAMALLLLTMAQAILPDHGCALNCWENTKYVSECYIKKDGCLCSEEIYKKSLHQCLYSQCDRDHYGLAVQRIASRCSKLGVQFQFASLPQPNRDELRRREREYVRCEKELGAVQAGVIISASAIATQSLDWLVQSAGYATQSADYATRSAGYAATSEITAASAASLPLSSEDTVAQTTIVPFVSSRLELLPSTNSFTTTPEVFLGDGVRLDQPLLPIVLVSTTWWLIFALP